jgi:hypothetical protein
MQLSTPCAFIQRLNVFQPMFKPVTAQSDLVLRDRVKHERVVRIWRVAERKGFSGILCHLEFVISERIRI